MYQRFGSGATPRAVVLGHRITGMLLVLETLPVAYHCLWSFGFGDYRSPE